MKRYCPRCYSSGSDIGTAGWYFRKSDSQKIRRFKCKKCNKHFSAATGLLTYYQKKRRISYWVLKLKVIGVSIRKSAWFLKVDKKTIVRRNRYWTQVAKLENEKFKKALKKIEEFQLDDLETFEKTKCLPVSVTAAVLPKSRKIIGFRASQMPAKGLLAEKSRKKYGPRKDKRAEGRKELFTELKDKVLKGAVIWSDESPHYPNDVKRFFPHCEHKRVKGKRGCVTGQGELKKVGFDPLFSLNHTFAMMRYGLSRLIRKSWCHSKKIQYLRDDLETYMFIHNKFFTPDIKN